MLLIHLKLDNITKLRCFKVHHSTLQAGEGRIHNVGKIFFRIKDLSFKEQV